MRTSLCIDCRVLLPSGDRCEINARHQIVDLDDADGRDALRTAVWEAPRVRRFVTPETRVLVAALVGAAVILTSLLFGPWGALIALLAIVVMPGMLLTALAMINRSYRPALPQGTTSYMLLPWRRSQRGFAHSDASIEAPLTGRSCIGYIVCYRTNQYYGGDVMLVDCATGGFVVSLDDGREINVPAGRFRLEVPDPLTITDRGRVEEHLAGIAEELRDERTVARPTVPFDTATEGLLVDGDRVELFCKVNEVAMSYRDSAKRLVPISVPRVRVLTPAD